MVDSAVRVDHAAELVRMVKSIDRTRAASTCGAFADVAAMSKPSSMEEAVARTKQNVLSFGAIYAGGTTVVLAVSAFASPLRLLLFVVMLASWWAYGSATDPLASTTIGSTTVGPALKAACVVALNLVVLVFGGVLSSLLWVGGVGLVASVAHAACHEAWSLPPPIADEFI